MKRFLSSVVPAIVVLAFAGPASADIPGQNVNVQAQVNTACTIQSGAGPIALTSVLSTTGAVPASSVGALAVRCTRGTTVSVAAGTADAGSFGRTVACSTAATCGAETIGYSLYVSSAGWGGGTPSTLLSSANVAMGTSPNKGTDLAISYQAQFDPAADPRAGTYDDTVAVTYTVAP